MKKLNKKIVLAFSTVLIMLGLAGSATVFAATSPSLGTASTYGVLADTFNYNIGLTTIIGTAGQAALGYVGAFPGGGATLAVTGTTEVNNAARTQAGLDMNSALNNVVDGLNIQVCTSIGAIVDLAAYDMDGAGPLPPGTFTPGCYSSTGAMSVGGGGTVTLSGSGTFIFRPTGALNTTANSIVQLAGGASECDVFWAPTAATTLGADSTFIGYILDAAGITIGNNVDILGSALAYGGTVTADTDTITVPVCLAPPLPPSGGANINGTITVVKTVINDNGGTMIDDDFPLFVNGMSVDSGTTNTFLASANAYAVTETTDPNYTQTFSVDCDLDGLVLLNNAGDNRLCVITNDDIGAPVVVPPVPPLIDVVKVPNPLALPDGPGLVRYTYTVRNIGTVPMTDVTMVGDTCSPIVLFSGDTNADAILDLNETWIYRCSTTLTETHTNTVVVTGWANGISATDIASATVVVGSPVVPPLIHVTKVPSPLTLPYGGGMVTYTKQVTNPGTVALSNVVVTDDKCGPVNYISGDTNSDSLLDTTETWIYTCRTNLTATTLNTATATGEANGQTFRDIALATVTVATAVPALPNTGFGPTENVFVSSLVAMGIMAVSILLYSTKKN